jgi:hypothetical protein
MGMAIASIHIALAGRYSSTGENVELIFGHKKSASRKSHSWSSRYCWIAVFLAAPFGFPGTSQAGRRSFQGDPNGASS